MIGNFFHIPGAKRFNFKPRYYDEQKDFVESRERLVKAEMGIKDENDKPFRANIKGSFRSGISNSKSVEDARRNSNWRIIFLVIILTAIVYVFFYTDWIF